MHYSNDGARYTQSGGCVQGSVNKLDYGHPNGSQFKNQTLVNV